MPNRRLPARVRALVESRAKGHCEYCQCSAAYVEPFTVDHILPRARGGDNSLDNLAFACFACNGAKLVEIEGVDTVTGRVAPLFHPRHDRWEDHFCWSANYEEMIGLTATGRVTIAVLHLNRFTLINIRRVLRASGLHPPPV